MSKDTSQTTDDDIIARSVALLVEQVKAEERARCVAIIRKHEMDWDDAIDEIENG